MRIFVYGTLRLHQPAYMNFGLDKLTNHIATVKIPGSLYNLGGYPGYRINPRHSLVTGDLLEIKYGEGVNPLEVLRKLDMYEGYHDDKPRAESLYTRRMLKVMGQSAYIYEIVDQPDESLLIHSGDWLNARA